MHCCGPFCVLKLSSKVPPVSDALPISQSIRRGGGAIASDRCQLTYEDRFLRRKRLTSESGRAFLVDLESATHLDDGDAFELDDASLIAVSAAPETLVAVTGPELNRLAWHIGNRHTPCQVESQRLVIARDHVIEAMLTQLGATLTPIAEPFLPEGGAYGHGRTFAHDHGHGHEHTHEH